MIFDAHVHLNTSGLDFSVLPPRLEAAGVGGCALISLPPPAAVTVSPTLPARERLEHLMRWTRSAPGHIALYWVDPLESDAAAQVTAAVEAGVDGFKMICDRYHVYESKSMDVIHRIARSGKPILFHAGILWDAKDSSKYNLPVYWEALLEVPKVRFSLAHIAWPWCDELIAVYGKFLNASEYRPELSAEMFIDMTPGTPRIYREEVLRKLFLTGYDVAENLIFGSDCCVEDYSVAWTREWIDRDDAIYSALGIDEQTRAGIYGLNFERFLGLRGRAGRPARPQVAV